MLQDVLRLCFSLQSIHRVFTAYNKEDQDDDADNTDDEEDNPVHCIDTKQRTETLLKL